jgi:hypothetical protein
MLWLADGAPDLQAATFRARTDAGESQKCPTCSKPYTVYKRKLNSGMVHTLIHMHRLTRDGQATNSEGWLPMAEVMNRGMFRNREYQRLRCWSMVEPHETSHRTATENSKGLWRITEKGQAFVERRVTVPSHVLVCDKRVLGFTDTMIDVVEALDTKFDYAELMGA